MPTTFLGEIFMATTTETRITCEECGALVHSIEKHLEADHPGITLAQYQDKHPDAPVMSELLLTKLRERMAAQKSAAPEVSVSADSILGTKVALHTIFGLPSTAATLSSSGKPIMLTVLNRDAMEEIDLEMIPAIDPNYVFNIDVLRTLLMGIEVGIPTYLWGHAGTGKTTIWEQICARLNRPMVRVQHTANMEESMVTGQYLLRDGNTHFEQGALMTAMRRGWVYLADEYDFGRPEVLSVYQPVLEGKPLVVKEAEASLRVTRPNAQFRVVGTGNTNGTGDESGLYQGTLLQNAANYERFGITEQMPYMEASLEARVVSQQGGIPLADAKKLVDFANRIREQFAAGKMSMPISPRTLIYAARVGKGRASFLSGLEKAYINRLTRIDAKVASDFAQRVFA
jgi:cobaltochelatase CobS